MNEEKEVYLIRPNVVSNQMNLMIEAFCEEILVRIIDLSKDSELKNKKLVFAVDLDEIGFCRDIYDFIMKLYKKGNDCLLGSSAVILICSKNQFYTKEKAQEIMFLLNRLGCEFMGHPVVEATASYLNLLTWQKTIESPLKEICAILCKRQSIRLLNDSRVKKTNLNITVLHSSSNKTSNTLALWNMVKKNLNGYEYREFNVENGSIVDCKGCSFKECLHHSKQTGCFYGGVMVDEIYPSIEKSDALIWLAPNYNDAISANLTAVVNRITALYRKISFYDKSIFSVIVSGNSGSDSIARQLLGALNINKGFRLPPYFCMMETANDPGAIKKLEGIENRAKAFSMIIRGFLE